MLFWTRYSRTMLKLSSTVWLTQGNRKTITPLNPQRLYAFRESKPLPLGFNRKNKTNLPRETVLPLLEEELENSHPSQRYPHVMNLLRHIKFDELPSSVAAKVFVLLEEELKNPNASLRYEHLMYLTDYIPFHILPLSILVKALLSQRDILKKESTIIPNIKDKQYGHVDRPFILFLVEEGLLLQSLDNKILSTDIMVNTVDQESGYTPITTTIAILADLDKAPPTMEHKETYTRLAVRFLKLLIENGADPTIADHHGNTLFTLLKTLPKTFQKDIKRILVDNESKYEDAKVFIDEIKEGFKKEEKRKKLYYHGINLGFCFFGAAIGNFFIGALGKNLINDGIKLEKKGHAGTSKIQRPQAPQKAYRKM